MSRRKGRRAKSIVIKRSILIDGHRTSVTIATSSIEQHGYEQRAAARTKP
jgi:hypothetical protein